MTVPSTAPQQEVLLPLAPSAIAQTTLRLPMSATVESFSGGREGRPRRNRALPPYCPHQGVYTMCDKRDGSTGAAKTKMKQGYCGMGGIVTVAHVVNSPVTSGRWVISLTWLFGRSRTQFVHRPPSCPVEPPPSATTSSTPCYQ